MSRLLNVGGDPGPFAWAVTLLYGLAAIWCVRAHRRGGTPFWWLAALLLLALGINKQLDLQTDLIAWLRALSRSGRWYGHRRLAEAAALWAGVLLLAAGAWIGWRRRIVRGPGAAVAAAGLALLALAIAARASKILHVSSLALPTGLIHDALEPAGLLVVLLGAERAIRSHPARRRRRR